MGRKPRFWTTGIVYELTPRCEHQLFLIRPDEHIENIMGSVLGRALLHYPVKLHSFDTNINHFHCLFSLAPDQIGNASRFLRYLNGQSAKQINIHLKRNGRVWSSRSRIVPIVDDEAVITRLIYAACNVVKDGMVEKASHWPGFSTYEQLAKGKRQIFKYLDKTAWWKAGGWYEKVPKDKYIRQVSVEASPLPGWEDVSPHKRQSKYRNLVRNHEKELKEHRDEYGRPVLGKYGLIRTDPFDAPTSPRKPTPMPKCHASSKEIRKSFINEVLKPFWRAFFQASVLFLDGIINIEFPEGSIPPPITTIYTRSRLRAL